MSSSAPYRLLEWDSHFFGFPTGACHPAEPTGLGLAVQAAQRDGLRLLYIFPPEVPSPDLSDALIRLGAWLADVRLTYALPLTPHPLASPAPEIRRWPADSGPAQLLPLALASGTYSRFRTDPRMPADAFSRLYHRWIERSVSGEIADYVWAAGPGDTPQGLLTLKISGGGDAQIGLLGVAEEARGRGIGQALVRQAAITAAARGASRLLVATQQANNEACRFYEKNGFSLWQSQPVWHYWLEAIA